MKQTYKTLINRLKLSNNEFNLIKELSVFSKNLYNTTLYEVRQHFFQTNKYLSYNKVYHLVKKNENYKMLPSQTAQQTLKFVDRDMRSFFNLLSKKTRNEYKEKVHIPRYKDKAGCFLLVLTPAHFKIKDNKVFITCKKELLEKHSLKKLSIPFPANLKDKIIKEIRILPQLNGKRFKVAFVYKETPVTKLSENNNFLSIDLGIDNLITMVDNVNKKPIIFSGKQIKAHNQYFNKKIANLKSILKTVNKKETSNQIQALYEKRNNIFKDIFHKVSGLIVNYCIKNNITEIIIGYNKEWKQNVKLGKKNNQSFVQIPYGKLNQYITYKGETYGIKVKLQEESYTSKCSSLSNEKIEKKENYNGKRIFRGLYKDLILNKVINADVNGAINIARKCKGESVRIADSGLVNNPFKLKVSSEMNLRLFNEAICL